jgi:hypothetical protein
MVGATIHRVKSDVESVSMGELWDFLTCRSVGTASIVVNLVVADLSQ